MVIEAGDRPTQPWNSRICGRMTIEETSEAASPPRPPLDRRRRHPEAEGQGSEGLRIQEDRRARDSIPRKHRKNGVVERMQRRVRRARRVGSDIEAQRAVVVEAWPAHQRL
jgi:hypothetical protein